MLERFRSIFFGGPVIVPSDALKTPHQSELIHYGSYLQMSSLRPGTGSGCRRRRVHSAMPRLFQHHHGAESGFRRRDPRPRSRSGPGRTCGETLHRAGPRRRRRRRSSPNPTARWKWWPRMATRKCGSRPSRDRIARRWGGTGLMKRCRSFWRRSARSTSSASTPSLTAPWTWPRHIQVQDYGVLIVFKG